MPFTLIGFAGELHGNEQYLVAHAPVLRDGDRYFVGDTRGEPRQIPTHHLEYVHQFDDAGFSFYVTGDLTWVAGPDLVDTLVKVGCPGRHVEQLQMELGAWRHHESFRWGVCSRNSIRLMVKPAAGELREVTRVALQDGHFDEARTALDALRGIGQNGDRDSLRLRADYYRRTGDDTRAMMVARRSVRSGFAVSVAAFFQAVDAS